MPVAVMSESLRRPDKTNCRAAGLLGRSGVSVPVGVWLFENAACTMAAWRLARAMFVSAAGGESSPIAAASSACALANRCAKLVTGDLDFEGFGGLPSLLEEMPHPPAPEPGLAGGCFVVPTGRPSKYAKGSVGAGRETIVFFISRI